MCVASARAVAPDETAFDVLRALRCSRSSGLPCLDAHLPNGRLGPTEVLVLLGEPGHAKRALVQCLLATTLAPTDAGGGKLPAVLIDADGNFDIGGMATLLSARLSKSSGATDLVSRNSGLPLSGDAAVEEALSRLLVLRPREPADLLRQLYDLREVFVSNPTASLLVVDSMSAWQSLTWPFPRSAAAVLREAWRALENLQREHCIAVVATCTHPPPGPCGRRLAVVPLAPRMRPPSALALGGEAIVPALDSETDAKRGVRELRFVVVPHGDKISHQAAFALSEFGDVVSVPA